MTIAYIMVPLRNHSDVLKYWKIAFESDYHRRRIIEAVIWSFNEISDINVFFKCIFICIY